MATEDTQADEDMQTDRLIEERPAPGTVIRHRGADIDIRSVERGSTAIELRRGAAWVRATADGPGLLVTHGAATVQVRDGAAVVEVLDFEALLVVIAGRAAIKGAAALPRSVAAGQAITLTLDGSFGDPEVLAAGELATDRMVVENLALDAIGSASARPARSATDAPGPGGVVDGPPPDAPRPEASTLQSALAGVGVEGADDPPHPAEPSASVTEEVADAAPAAPDAPDRVEEPPPDPGDEPDAAGAPVLDQDEDDVVAEEDEVEGDAGPLSPTSRRVLVALIVLAIIVVAVVAALVVTRDDTQAAGGPAVLVPAQSTQSTEVGAEARAPSEVEAEINACRFRDDGYGIQGTISGGGQLVARYAVTVAVVDADGEVYSEVTERVVPSDDRARPSDFEVSVPLAADEVRPGSSCEVVEAEALRIAPR